MKTKNPMQLKAFIVKQYLFVEAVNIMNGQD